MVWMKQPAVGNTDIEVMEDLRLAVGLHRLDGTLIVLWTNTALYRMLEEKQKDFKESIVFPSYFSDFIQGY